MRSESEKLTNATTTEIYNPLPDKRSYRICSPDDTIIAAQDCVPFLGTELFLSGFLSQWHLLQDLADASELLFDWGDRGVQGAETVKQDERLRGGDVADGALIQAPYGGGVGGVEEGAAEVERGVWKDLQRWVS